MKILGQPKPFLPVKTAHARSAHSLPTIEIPNTRAQSSRVPPRRSRPPSHGSPASSSGRTVTAWDAGSVARDFAYAGDPGPVQRRSRRQRFSAIPTRLSGGLANELAADGERPHRRAMPDDRCDKQRSAPPVFGGYAPTPGTSVRSERRWLRSASPKVEPI
jgi:hypothetical protein